MGWGVILHLFHGGSIYAYLEFFSKVDLSVLIPSFKLMWTHPNLFYTLSYNSTQFCSSTCFSSGCREIFIHFTYFHLCVYVWVLLVTFWKHNILQAHLVYSLPQFLELVNTPRSSGSFY